MIAVYSILVNANYATDDTRIQIACKHTTHCIHTHSHASLDIVITVYIVIIVLQKDEGSV